MRFIWRVAPWLVTFTLLAGTVLVAALGFASDRRELESTRTDVARSAAGALESSLMQTVEQTATVASLFDSSRTVSQAEFNRFAAPLLRQSGSSGLAWMEHVVDGRRRSFERSTGPILRVEGKKLVRQSRRPEYEVYTHILGRQKSARDFLGLDVGSFPARVATLRAARAARAARSTPIVRTAGTNMAVTLIFSPLFDQRTGALRGYATGSYRVDRLGADIRAVLPAGSGIRLTQGGRTTVEFGPVAGGVRRSVTVAGQRWDLVAAAPKASGFGYGLTALLVGLPLSAMLGLAVALMARRNRESEEVARLRTTERDDAERERRASDNRLAIAFKEAPIGMAMLDFEGRFFRVNRALAQITGYPAPQLATMRLSELVPADHHVEMRQPFEDAAADRLEPFTVEHPIVDAAGEERWVAVHATTLNGSDGRPELMLAQVLDVTEHRRIGQALEAKERQTRQILETAHDAFISLDADGRVTDWNSRAQATFGWTRAEALGRSFEAAILPERLHESSRRDRARLVESGGSPLYSEPFEQTGRHKDGTELPVEVTLSATAAGDGYAFNLFIRDITQRRRAQEALDSAHAQAIEAARLKTDFVANMSHEIRTPLNGVIGMSGLLLDTDLTAEQRDFVEAVRISGDALMGVVTDILDFSKIEAGKLEIETEPFEIRPIVEDTAAIGAPAARAKRVKLMTWVDPALPEVMCGDGNRLRQVLNNLVSNAVKFTQQGEVAVHVTAAEPSGDHLTLRFEVSDTGIGIDGAALSRVFDSFAQQDGSTTRRFGGTGLGLAISKQLVELMGGEIGVRSIVDEGSTFWFAVPVRLTDDPPERLEGPKLDGARVLAVDDNATNLTILERQLTSWGLECDTISDPAAVPDVLAREAGAGRPYQLVIVDSRMPLMSGDELTRVIRSTAPISDLAVLMMSSSGNGRQAALEAGVNGFVTKPVREARLLDQVLRVLRPADPVAARDAGASALRTPVMTLDRGEGGEAEGPLVLVAEDNRVNQRVAAALLGKRGYRVDLAANGREAVEMHDRGTYAAIFMDCQMPELDGYEATAEIRRHEGPGSHVPIVAMTASTLTGDRDRCMEAGMDYYISKPVRTADLDTVLGRLRSRS